MTLLARTGIVNTYSQPFSATGGTITDSGGYRYHTFNSSGSFVVSSGSKTVEVLAVGGGGSGGTSLYGGKTGGPFIGGGGGGGGLYESKSIDASTGTYTVLVGAGAVSGGLNGYPYNGVPSCVTTSNSTTAYAVGDIGPAGGRIFMTPSYYDNGLTNPTGMYFEAAPVSGEVSRTWAESTYQTTAVNMSFNEIGYGYNSTNNIVAQGNSDASTCAAKYCADYTLNGFSDWFLPSIYEMTAMAQAGNSFRTNASINLSTAYWTSSQIYGYNYQAYSRVFNSYFAVGQAKSTSNLVRPVRAFTTAGNTLIYGAGGTGGGAGDNTPAPGGKSMFYGGNTITNTSGAKSGGGGGAGAVGADGTADLYNNPLTGGAGGAGTTWNSFKSFGGGGGGGGANNYSPPHATAGAGGTFGGGAGGTFVSGVPNSGTAGTANTGGGGGGAYYDSGYLIGGASGGSGVVIVRYLL